MAYSPKVIALAQFLNVSPGTVTEDRSGLFEADSELGEYLVLTDDEADAACDEALENYIDECIIAELPETVRETWGRYFNREAWKRDAILSDGRGHTLSLYDGEEHDERVLTNEGPVYFYIYRVN